ncbi:MAG TPA: 3D domain-containing protein [Polyangiales bacterium]|nr:3D domain-containing protein [Polyangiales bacterium]
MKLALVVLSASLGACATSGSAWMAEPLVENGEQAPRWVDDATPPPSDATRSTRRITEEPAPTTNAIGSPGAATTSIVATGGRSLGTFRNTYYDFPRELDFAGPQVAVKNARCETISQVPREFFESLCVQGSGTLRSGATVSFAKRDCACAELCPRTSQHICFDQLDPKLFPFGRGATGKAITPLLSVAVDSNVIPLGTPLYIPEFEGLPREVDGTTQHDGCFVAQDRGIRVTGQHVDVFTGFATITALWNRKVPSNQGVTVIVDSPRCPRP